MNNDWAFLPMRSSNELLGDRARLRERLDDDGYLYFHQVLDRRRLSTLRERVVASLAECGWVEPTRAGGPLCLVDPVREGDSEFLGPYGEVQRLEEFHTLAHDETLTSIMTDVLGGPAFAHPLKIARLIFPGNYEISTPPHQDWPNNQGTTALTASWIPLHDLTWEMGGLAILRGSHRYGVLELAGHPGPGNRCAVVPEQMLEECRWVTTRYALGDVVLFPALTVHAATHNASEVLMRLSVDFRYQREGEALTELCLEPHFQTLSWPEIYEGWASTDHQYYWKHHSYEVVPFQQMPIAEEAGQEYRPGAHQRRLDARGARRQATLRELGITPAATEN